MKFAPVLFFIIAALCVLCTGCDEGMNMIDPIVKPGDPEPTVTINTVVQADDGSVAISGTSTDIPEGAEVTIVLGDDAITVKTTVDKDDTWSATVPAKRTAQLTAGTVAVTAAAGGAKATSSFSFEQAPEPIEPHENDFVGQAVTLLLSENALSIHARAVSGVTLTVVSGERAGEQSVSDEEGNYRFSDSTGETLRLHLRAEGEGYETKEVIVHRTEATTTLADGIIFTRDRFNPQKNPGTVLIGHAWPDEVRFILEKTLLPHDLLLVRAESLRKTYSGLYAGVEGVVMVKNGNCLLHTIAHELGHAHQHAVAVMEGGPNTSIVNWENTPEGKAYMEAWDKDWEEVGKVSYDGGYLLTPRENMAETANNFWNIEGKFDNRRCFSTLKMAEEVPNRLRWAQEWLSKKYD